MIIFKYSIQYYFYTTLKPQYLNTCLLAQRNDRTVQYIPVSFYLHLWNSTACRYGIYLTFLFGSVEFLRDEEFHSCFISDDSVLDNEEQRFVNVYCFTNVCGASSIVFNLTVINAFFFNYLNKKEILVKYFCSIQILSVMLGFL